jgi:hypothetical protein
MKTHNTHYLLRLITVAITTLCTYTSYAAVGIIDLNINDTASDSFEIYYYDGSTLTPTTHAGFKAEKYPLINDEVQSTYLLTDTISLLSQQTADLSFTFNGQGLQTLKLELLDMADNVLWTYCNDNLYSGTSAKNGTVQHQTVESDVISISLTSNELPTLCRLRLSAYSGKASYKLHLHALNLYSTPLPWDQCRLQYNRSPIVSHNGIYVEWISLNGASDYRLLWYPNELPDSPASIVLSPIHHATQSAIIPIADMTSCSYMLETNIDGHTIAGPMQSVILESGYSCSPSTAASVKAIVHGIIVESDTEGTAHIYTIDGLLFSTLALLRNSQHTLPLPPGLYIVTLPDMTTAKVLVDR